MKLRIQYLAVVFTAFLPQFGMGGLSAPLPKFKSKEQLVKPMQQHEVKALDANQNTFYTGKPYEKAREGYLFKYRSYAPELTRWTSADPSGFPDGANSSHYCPIPTEQLDYQGLETITITHNFLPMDGQTTPTIVQGTIQGSWTTAPNLADVRWGFGSKVSGGSSQSFGGTTVTNTWTAKSPNIIIDNITDDGAEWVKTYSMDVTYEMSVEITFTSQTAVSFSYRGVSVNLAGSGETSTLSFNYSYDGHAQLSVAE